MNATYEHIGWYNPDSKRFCYNDEIAHKRQLGYWIPVYAGNWKGELDEWKAAFPGKTVAEITLLLATFKWAIKANGRLLAENERLRSQRPLTAEEKAWAEKAWQEYKASPPKDEITCIQCGFKVSRPVEGRAASNCQTCGTAYGREAFL